MAPRRIASRTPVRSRRSDRCRRPNAQQGRHDEVVAHHGAERHRLDDDHAGRRGKSADEGKQRNRLLVLGHRQGQHERVGVHAPLREVEQAAERDRQHEDVDQQEIEREEPDRLFDVALVDVLDHEHLELSGQDENRQHGEHGERDPARVAGARIDGEQPGQIARSGGVREQVAEPLIDAESDEHSYREERQELDHRTRRRSPPPSPRGARSHRCAASRTGWRRPP